jgi:hypothetical protein
MATSTKGVATLLRKGILILSNKAPPLLILSSNNSCPFINGTVADVSFLTVIGVLASWFLLN